MTQLSGKYFWSAATRVGAIVLSFLFNLILARWFLSPREFGLIGMLQIFIAVGATTVTGGFSQALVQKRHLHKADVNTAYTFNVGVSVLIYILLFLFAPRIANLYGVEELTEILRWLALVLVINAFQLVPYSLFLRYQLYKKLFAVVLISTLSGYVLGFLLARRGYGVWSLVCSTLSISFFATLLFYVLSPVRPRFAVSALAFRELVPFSGYIYLATLVEQVYANALAMILGKRFDAVTLGYYTQANKLQNVPAAGVQEVVHQVLLPEFSRHQSNLSVLKAKYIQNLRFLTLVASWVFSVLYVVAEPAVLILYTDKWLPSVPLLRILCPAGLFFVLFYIPTLLVRAIGKARSYFFLLLVEYAVAIVLLVYLSFYGVKATLYGVVCVNAFCFIVNTAYLSRLRVGVGFIEQIKVVLPVVLGFGAVGHLLLLSFVRFGVEAQLWKIVIGVLGPSVLAAVCFFAGGGARFLRDRKE